MFPKNCTRRIQERFYKTQNPNLERHKNLLRIATQNNQIRLITTNFDNYFEQAFDQLYNEIPHFKTVDCSRYNAPLLPPARMDRWSGIVKLHGTVHQKNLRDELILTAGDFGRAYLSEGWAAKFVIDIFKNFHVLFVGYSLNDPILKYIMDAYSLDKLNDENLKSAYILLPEDRGLEQLPGTQIKIYHYPRKDNSHTGLDDLINTWMVRHNTSEWQAKSRIEELAKKNDIIEDEARELIHYLKYSPQFIKYFCQSPSSSIKWLPYLDNAGLLVAFECEASSNLTTYIPKPNFAIPLVVTSQSYSAIQLSGAAEYWCDWLSKHIDKIELIDWILKKGGIIHPALKDSIDLELWKISKKEKTPFEDLLRLLMDHTLVGFNVNSLHIEMLKNIQLTDEQNANARLLHLLSALAPSLRIKGNSLSFALSVKQSNKSKLKRIKSSTLKACYADLFEVEFLSIHDQKDIIGIIANSNKNLASISLDVFILLKRTLELLYLIKGNVYYSIARPYIGDHKENPEYLEWGPVLDLLRDSLRALFKLNSQKAFIIIKLLFEEGSAKTQHNNIFLRIALYALTFESTDLNANEKFDIAWLYHKDWFYSYHTTNEVQEFIQNFWDKLEVSSQDKVINYIIQAYDEIEKEENDTTLTSIQVLHSIEWLKIAAENLLPKRLENIYKEINSHYPIPQTPNITNPYSSLSLEAFNAFSVQQHLDFLHYYSTKLLNRVQ